jgi:hypothetical protein
MKQATTSGKNSTLLDLVWAVTQSESRERDVVAIVTGLINSGQVRLCGTFAGARIEETTPYSAASPVFLTPRTTE